MMESLSFAVTVLIENWHIALLATLFGMAMGVNPGLGGSVGLAIMASFTVGTVDRPTAFLIYGCVIGATSFSGSISAILANVPGGGGNAATLLDGYPLARKGKGGLAISASAFSSAFGAIVGLAVFLILIPVVIEVALLFGPSEMFWVIIIGLSIIPLVAGEKVIMGFAVGVLGLFFGLYGRSLATAEIRYSYGIPGLVDGFDLVPVIIGVFAFAELIRLSVKNEGRIVKGEPEKPEGTRLGGLKAWYRHRWVWLRGSILGTLVGAVPGAGASVATFVSYGQAVATSSNPSSFGKGNIAGVIASESANDSKDGGQLFPAFGLGIPGSGSTAVLLGVFVAHGILPGPSLLVDHLELMLTVVAGLFVANIFSSTIGLIFVNHLTIVTRLRIEYLYPSIILIGLFSSFFLRNSALDMVVAVVFGLLGYILLVHNISRVPIIIAFVLGPIMEDNFWIAVQLENNFFTPFFTGWMNILLIGILLLLLGFGRRQQAKIEEIGNDQTSGTETEELGNDQTSGTEANND